MTRILVTPRSLSRGDHPGLAPLREAGYELVCPSPGATPSEEQLKRAVPGCVGWLAGVEPVSEAVIAAAQDLRVIARNGTGVDNLPLETLRERGIALRRAVGTNSRSVAELALALTLAGLRHIVPTHTGLKSGDWPRRIGREIGGAEVAVIGLGAVGMAFAELCLVLGARVRGHDPFAEDARPAAGDPAGSGESGNRGGFRRCSLAEAIEGAEALSLHAPLPPDGAHLLGAPELARLRPGAVVVNTARAGLVDNSAMLSALESGQVAAYATDVFHAEPPQPSALLRHPNVILTSHIGGFTEQAVERTTRRAVEDLLGVLGACTAAAGAAR